MTNLTFVLESALARVEEVTAAVVMLFLLLFSINAFTLETELGKTH